MPKLLKADSEYVFIETDNKARKILSVPFNTAKHVCAKLDISKDTYNKWCAEKSTFKSAVEKGFLDGEVTARKLLSIMSICPTSKANTKLLMLLAENVYGIKTDLEINFNTSDSSEIVDPERVLREKGIPIPIIDTEDL